MVVGKLFDCQQAARLLGLICFGRGLLSLQRPSARPVVFYNHIVLSRFLLISVVGISLSQTLDGMLFCFEQTFHD